MFAAWGNGCVFCDDRATDAAHIVDRNELGPHRWECARENGRPVCRPHHEQLHRHELQFPKSVYNAAVRALNRVMKQKLKERQ